MPSEDIIQKTQTKEEQIVRNFYSVLETAGISDDSVFEKARKIVGDHLAVSP